MKKCCSTACICCSFQENRGKCFKSNPHVILVMTWLTRHTSDLICIVVNENYCMKDCFSWCEEGRCDGSNLRTYASFFFNGGISDAPINLVSTSVWQHLVVSPYFESISSKFVEVQTCCCAMFPCSVWCFQESFTGFIAWTSYSVMFWVTIFFGLLVTLLY